MEPASYLQFYLWSKIKLFSPELSFKRAVSIPAVSRSEVNVNMFIDQGCILFYIPPLVGGGGKFFKGKKSGERYQEKKGRKEEKKEKKMKRKRKK